MTINLHGCRKDIDQDKNLIQTDNNANILYGSEVCISVINEDLDTEERLLSQEPSTEIIMVDWITGDNSKNEVIELLDRLTTGTQFVRYLLKSPEEITNLSVSEKYWAIFDAIWKNIEPIYTIWKPYFKDGTNLSEYVNHEEIEILYKHLLLDESLDVYQLDSIEDCLGLFFGTNRVKFRTGFYRDQDADERYTYITESSYLLYHNLNQEAPVVEHIPLYEIVSYREENQFAVISIHLITIEPQSGLYHPHYSCFYDYTQQKILSVFLEENISEDNLSIDFLLTKSNLTRGDLGIIDLAFFRTEEGIRFLGLLETVYPLPRYIVEPPNEIFSERKAFMINREYSEGIPLYYNTEDKNDIIIRIPVDEVFTIIGTKTNNSTWVFVDFKGQEGWVDTLEYPVTEF